MTEGFVLQCQNNYLESFFYLAGSGTTTDAFLLEYSSTLSTKTSTWIESGTSVSNLFITGPNIIDFIGAQLFFSYAKPLPTGLYEEGGYLKTPLAIDPSSGSAVWTEITMLSDTTQALCWIEADLRKIKCRVIQYDEPFGPVKVVYNASSNIILRPKMDYTNYGFVINFIAGNDLIVLYLDHVLDHFLKSPYIILTSNLV